MSRSPSRAERIATPVAVLTGLLAAATVVGHLANRGIPVATVVPDAEVGFWLVHAMKALVFAVPGWFLATRRPGVAFGWLALAAGLSSGLAGIGLEWALAAQLGGRDVPMASVGAWLYSWGPIVELPVLATAYVMFPDGQLRRGRSRIVAVAAIGLTSLGLLVAVLQLRPFATSPDSRMAGLETPFGLGGLPPVEALIAPGMILATILVVVRWRRAKGEDRRVLSWLAGASAVAIVIVPSVFLAPPAIGFAIGEAATLLEVTVIAVAALRHHVYGIEVVLNRALVYGGLTAVVAAVYAAAVGIGGTLGEGGATGSSFVGALVAALLFAPARVRLQSVVNRFLYGDRDEPYAVVSRVAAQLGAAGSAEQLLPGLARATADALRVPYVGVRLAGAEGQRTIAHGEPGPLAREIALVHQGRTLGALLVGRRPGETGIGARENRLLEDVAQQAAVAASNVVLTEDLRRSRERIVVAREEERLRLRRDLHDGLGPQLTGVVLGLDVVSEQLAASAPQASVAIDGLRTEVHDAIVDVRRLVHDLRPPRLDEVGLVEAIREMADRTGRGGLEITVRAPTERLSLSAAVEVAAYRIAAEAITNVVRHAGARSCDVGIDCDGVVLHLSVTDDGRGRAVDDIGGVGTSSMRERAEEVGGTLAIGAAGLTGCRVEASLPMGSRAA